jgi:D-sedoheptulose 7-phosphate isomerase
MSNGSLAGAAGRQQWVEAWFQQSCDVPLQFFAREADRVAQACLAMADRFQAGGRLLAFGAGNALTDAQHVAVEFVHPVIVGKRALPAIALGSDMAATTGLARQYGWPALFSRQVQTIARPADIALGIDPTGNDEAVGNGIAAARARGLLTLALTGGDGGALAQAPTDFCFIVPVSDAALIQETHETLYHILWELVHVFVDASAAQGAGARYE